MWGVQTAVKIRVISSRGEMARPNPKARAGEPRAAGLDFETEHPMTRDPMERFI